jgi:rubrerythrin
LAGALDFAIVLEREARDRYLNLARVMQLNGFDDVGAFFTSMARMEEHHRVELEERRKRACGDAPTEFDVTGLRPHLEGPHSEEEAQVLTLRQALELALAAEGRARAFFVEALATLTDPEVRTLFAELGAEEVEHEALVQARLDSLAVL